MPVTPRTWNPGDPVTASYLNGDLYSVSGKQFWPNGVRFHARKPLYKATVPLPPNPPAGTNIGGGGNWTTPIPYLSAGMNTNVFVDSSCDYGAQMDAGFTGQIVDAVTFSDGASADIIGGGGWYLASAFTPMANTNAGQMYTNAIADGFLNNVPNVNARGTKLSSNGNHDITPYVVDLINVTNNPFFVTAQNNSNSVANLVFSPDGSGESFTYQAMWASVFAGNGSQVAAAPAPKTSWLSTDTVTASLLNGSTGIRDVLNILNMPPAIKVESTGSTSGVAASTPTVINLSNTPATNSYLSAWNGGTNTWTVPFSGLYFIHGYVAFTGATTTARCGINISGTNYWGPSCPSSTGNDNGVAKMQIFDLNAGDTIQLMGYQTGGGTISTSSNTAPHLIILWLGDKGASTLANPPDLSYRYPAVGATSAALAPFNTHLANDLQFLVNKPYLLSFQNAVQTGIVDGTDSLITMNNVHGIIHNANGDNYSGWNATNHNYAAVVPGWYMFVYELFFPSATLTNGSVIAETQLSANFNAANPTDWYGHNAASTSGPACGAAGIGYYYLRAGDTIAPWGRSQGLVSGNNSTVVTTGVNSHFELIWVSE